MLLSLITLPQRLRSYGASHQKFSQCDTSHPSNLSSNAINVSHRQSFLSLWHVISHLKIIHVIHTISSTFSKSYNVSHHQNVPPSWRIATKISYVRFTKFFKFSRIFLSLWPIFLVGNIVSHEYYFHAIHTISHGNYLRVIHN